ncbi:Serine/threonine-protein kinase [Mycoemilia scoparia]|uniref:Serine/threonine-protein kinase n=1 Tax=Mycoemilia scoparia TaxID=417184 RepID=A0A9W8DQT7_9FUNG|nr:Serine/threonine-protein kinase [Mycoemilia scoparia]
MSGKAKYRYRHINFMAEAKGGGYVETKRVGQIKDSDQTMVPKKLQVDKPKVEQRVQRLPQKKKDSEEQNSNVQQKKKEKPLAKPSLDKPPSNNDGSQPQRQFQSSSPGRNQPPITVSLKSRDSRRFLLHTPLGEFQIVRTLGQGSYGKVRLMQSALTQYQYAVKIIRRYPPHKHHKSHPEHRKAKTLDRRVAREANLAAILGQLHPNIVPLHDFRVTDTHLYLFYEFVDGMTLAEKIGTTGLLESAAKPIFYSLTDTIAFCHRYSIIHRDIKLENILLDNSHTPPAVKLIDFGLANFFDRKGLMATFCGSLPYTAPEILRGDAYVGPEVDIWSLGVLLYVMITAHFPFEDPSQPRNYDLIMAGEFKLRSSMSLELRNLLRRMIEPKIDKRITMDELLIHPWLEEYHNKNSASVDQPSLDDTSAPGSDGDNRKQKRDSKSPHFAAAPSNNSSNNNNNDDSVCSVNSNSNNNTGTLTEIPIRLPIDHVAAWEVAICLDIPLQKVLEKLPGKFCKSSNKSAVMDLGTESTSDSTCVAGVMMVPNCPVVSVYSLVVSQMEKRRWYSGVPNLETLSISEDSNTSQRYDRLGIELYASDQKRQNGKGAVRSQSAPLENPENKVPSVRSLGIMYEASDRILLPTALSSLPASEVLKKLNQLFKVHQIAFTFIETRQSANVNSDAITFQYMANGCGDVNHSLQKGGGGGGGGGGFWTSVVSLFGKTDSPPSPSLISDPKRGNTNKTCKHDNNLAGQKACRSRRHIKRAHSLRSMKSSGTKSPTKNGSTPQNNNDSTVKLPNNNSKPSLKLPANSPGWAHSKDSKEIFCPVNYPTCCIIAQYSPSLSRKRDIEVIEHYSCSVYLELVRMPIIPYRHRYALVIKRLAGHRGKYELFQGFMNRMALVLPYISTPP